MSDLKTKPNPGCIVEESFFQINHIDWNGFSPTIVAAMKGYVDCLDLLIENQANTNVSAIKSKMTGELL